MILTSLRVPLAIALVLMMPALSIAVPVDGTFAIGGSNATLSSTTVSFGCNAGLGLAPCPAPSNYGNFSTTVGTGSLAPYTFQGGYIHNLSQATTPLNQSFLLPNFVIFSSTAGNPVLPPDIALDLTNIFLGTDGQAGCTSAPATGQLCTPAFPGLVSAANPLGLSELNFQNISMGGGLIGSTASFSVAGDARRISTGELSPFSGVFTLQFTVPFQTVLATMATSGSITNSFSATFSAVAPVPEPSSSWLLIAGLVFVAVYANWKRRAEVSSFKL